MKTVLLVTLGAVLGGLIVWALVRTPPQTEDIAALAEEVERLRTIAPTQSHVMADTALQASSLWFAAQDDNWDLATFLFNETRGRIRWTVRINPKPKAAGSQEEADLQSLFDALDQDVLTPLKAAIDAKDHEGFEAGYRQMVEGCYSCHKSTNRPFLRPGIPSAPGLSVLNFDPEASWPQ